MSFKDHFSRQSVDYAKYRPHYPAALFEWLASCVTARDLAWDVGTGSGQAAVALASYFQKIIATDPAEAQLRNAELHERVTYKVMPAEQTDFPDASVDLIIVAQALHWFDFGRFYTEVARVAKPGAVVAAWAYGLGQISPAVDAIVEHYYQNIVGPYWPPERRYIDECYQTIPFPFGGLRTPLFTMTAHWTLNQWVGYLGTWSAGQRYEQTQGRNPIGQIADALAEAWGDATLARSIVWPIYLRAGKIDVRL